MLHASVNSFFRILQFFFCSFFLSNPAFSQVSAVDTRVLEQQLLQPDLLKLKKTDLADLQRLYTTRRFQPIWMTAEPESALLAAAIDFIASSETEGLDSRDYRLEQLRQLQQQANQSLPAAIELELLTSHAVLMLARDLTRGKLQASLADPDWHIPQATFDAVAFLQQAIETNRLPQSLHDLSPQKHHYQLLKQTLIRYQSLMHNHANWNPIPAAKTLHPGEADAIIPLIRQRMAQTYDIDGNTLYHLAPSSSPQYDAELVIAIKAFQIQHGLIADGVIGKNTIRALNIPLEWKIRQLRINMERLRWLPADLGQRYVLVNTAGFRLTAVKQDEPPLSMRIIVGRDYRSTPSFNGALSHMVLNPYWTVPVSIATKDLLPKQKKNPDYFTSNGFKIYSGHNRTLEPINPDTIDWQAINKAFPYVLKQDPGTHNALGRIKFMFSNSFSIYLHDTPSKSLFQKDIRTFSSGCIRLEKPLELAAFLLGEQSLPDKFLADMDNGKTKTVHLPGQTPIYLVYSTTWVDEQGQIHFSPDIYRRDLRALQYAGW